MINMNDNVAIHIVDDEVEYQNVLKMILKDQGYQVSASSNGVEALDYIDKNGASLVITDLKMPKLDGVSLIKRVKEKYPDIDFIVMTAFGSIESAVDSMKYGAADYFVKSGEMDDLLFKIDRLVKMTRLKNKSEILISNQNNTELFIDTKNQTYRELLSMCRRAADSGINLLILGESGVGKEVIAKYVHNLSERRNEPFVPVNCQAIPESIIESELFGHEKGAFTGATTRRIGKFEQANFGTLFLDEIGDLPISTQGKLLRAIENREIERIGGNKTIKLDIQFISATNKDIKECVAKGLFREDLLYRINTLTLQVPKLRDRKEDLPALIDFFVKKTEQEQGKSISCIESDVMNFLLGYDYPGNVRELKNIVERMIALSQGGVITTKELLLPLASNTASLDSCYLDKPFKEAREIFEKRYIAAVLANNDNNVARSARLLNISQRHLWNKIKQYKINL